MSLFEAALRVLTAIGVLVVIPGWLASRKPLRRVYILHSAFLGVAIYLGLLAVGATFSQRVDIVATFTGYGTIATILGGLVARRLWPVAAAHEPAAPPTLPWRAALVVATCVAAAASLRWLHNYHYDDLQHLLYLAELERTNSLFPQHLMARVGSITWLGADSAELLLSRYPFWGASYVVLARLAGVPVGDVYYLTGLVLLALTLGVITALLYELTKSELAATGGLLAFLVAGPTLTDDFLNFGGYPFQSGKLLVACSGLAAISFWWSRRLVHLTYVSIGLAAGPLLHANNIVGAGLLLAVLALAVAATGLQGAVRDAQRLVAAGLVTVGCLGVIGTAGIASGGFVRWVVLSPVAEETSGGGEISSLSSVPLASPDPAEPPGPFPTLSSVAARLQLFVRRAVPVELVCALTVALILAVLPPVSGGLRVAASAAIVAMAALLVTLNFAASLGSLIVTSMFKPGYLAMRHALVRASPLVEGHHLITDTITEIYGRAVGWSVPERPRLALRDQLEPLLVFHPAVGGDALQPLVRSRSALIIVNEAVLGPGAARKFDTTRGARRLFESAPRLDAEERLTERAEAAVRSLYALHYVSAYKMVRSEMRHMWRLLFDRPVVMFQVPHRLSAAQPTPRVLSQQQRADQASVEHVQVLHATDLTVPRPFLNSVMFEDPVPPSCFKEARLRLTGTATFDDSVAIYAVASGKPGVPPSVGSVRVLPNQTVVAEMPFVEPVCGPGAVRWFIHGGYSYDFRFDVGEIEWVHPVPNVDAANLVP